MSFERWKDTAIIVPARNEAERIGDCLTALAPQCNDRVHVILVVNNTDDDTAKIAKAAAGRLGLDLTVLDLTFPPGMGVGAARRKGCAVALEQMPHLRQILITDADCRVSPDWVARSIHHLQRFDALCGRVTLNPEEAATLAPQDPMFEVHEMTYRRLVLTLYARHAPNCADLQNSHGEAPGASLGFTRDAYEAVGGFAPIPCGEDRAIIRALRAASRRVLHADDVWVEASCRLVGRAAGGMADTLRNRLSGAGYFADDCLPDAARLIDQSRRGVLGCWPAQMSQDQRIPVEDLPAHIAMLRAFLDMPARDEAATTLPQAAPNRGARKNFPARAAKASEPLAAGVVELS
ncbi:glycosyltransferase [Sulfitobacter sp. 1A12126]|uniref:glycosyltransferase n=1 Tax=Sulfitobacter sp. 1A12126 TaxID=3368591 RepID=UPI003745C6EF